jgi:hypothetical protein
VVATPNTGNSNEHVVEALARPREQRNDIARWTSALPAPTYLVAATDIAGAELWRRWWPAELLSEAHDWLHGQTTRGTLVTARPWTTAHALVRGLRPEDYARLAAEHRVAAGVTDGAGFVEAWITLSDKPLDARVAARAAAVLAARHGGDLLGADARSLGVLPGLRGSAAADNAGAPPNAARLLTASPGIDAAAAAILADAAAALGCDQQRSPRPARAAHLPTRRANPHRLSRPPSHSHRDAGGAPMMAASPTSYSTSAVPSRALIPSLRTTYTPHDLRRALRLTEWRRRIAPAQGTGRSRRADLEELFRRGRTAGLLGRRRLVRLRFDLDAADVERALWATGARSIDELVVAALLRVALPKSR